MITRSSAAVHGPWRTERAVGWRAVREPLDPSESRWRAVREPLEILRRAVGERSYLAHGGVAVVVPSGEPLESRWRAGREPLESRQRAVSGSVSGEAHSQRPSLTALSNGSLWLSLTALSNDPPTPPPPHRSRHCLAARPCSRAAMSFHLHAPFSPTSRTRLSSSCGGGRQRAVREPSEISRPPAATSCNGRALSWPARGGRARACARRCNLTAL